jgi:hypothetical protein
MRRKIPVLLLCLAISLPASAMAQSKNAPSGIIPPEVAAAAESVMRLFTSLIGAIPTYEAPELMPNGDIIIRRKQPRSEQPAPKAPEKPKSTVPQDDTTPTRI